jgi:hypothetical protein
VERGREGVTAKIHVDPAAKLKFHKARPVPFALRGKIEEELEMTTESWTVSVLGLGCAHCSSSEG